MKRKILRWLSDQLHTLCYTFERWGRWVGRCQAPCPKCGELTAVINRLCSTCYLEDCRRRK
jgi:hypothetical protein